MGKGHCVKEQREEQISRVHHSLFLPNSPTQVWEWNCREFSTLKGMCALFSLFPPFFLFFSLTFFYCLSGRCISPDSPKQHPFSVCVILGLARPPIFPDSPLGYAYADWVCVEGGGCKGLTPEDSVGARRIHYRKQRVCAQPNTTVTAFVTITARMIYHLGGLMMGLGVVCNVTSFSL